MDLAQLIKYLIGADSGVFESLRPIQLHPEIKDLYSYAVQFPPNINKPVNAIGIAGSPELAKTKAIVEAVERYSFYVQKSRPNLIRSSINDLKTRSIEFLNPLSSCDFLNFQKSHPAFLLRSPQSIDELDWVPALCNGRESFVPLAYCLYGQPLLNKEISSSGNAAHFEKEKAQLNAILELIERDCFLSHWWRKKKFLAICKNSLPESLLQRLWQFAGPLLENISFWWGENEIGAPCVYARWRSNQFPHFLVAGSCKLNWIDALEQSFFEIIVNVSQYSDKNRFPPHPSSVFDSTIFKAKDHVDLSATQESAKVSDLYFDSKNQLQINHVTQTLNSLKDIENKLSHLNYSLYIVDMTPREARAVNIYVAKAICPDLISIEMRHIHRPWGHQKLRHLMQGRFQAVQHHPHPYP